MLTEEKRKEVLRLIADHVSSRRGMSNVLLQKVSSELFRFIQEGNPRKTFFGVHSIDEVPVEKIRRFVDDDGDDSDDDDDDDGKNREACLIVNLASKSAGETDGHFVAIHVKSDRIYYLDSFGMRIYKEGLRRDLSTLNRPIFSNVKQIQNMTSVFCPLFALLFTLYFSMCDPPFRMTFRQNHWRANELSCIDYLTRVLDYLCRHE